jgi:hypothetical protein
MPNNQDPKPTLNGQPVSLEQLQEAKEKLQKNERIVEVNGKPGDFRKLKRMQE